MVGGLLAALIVIIPLGRWRQRWKGILVPRVRLARLLAPGVLARVIALFILARPLASGVARVAIAAVPPATTAVSAVVLAVGAPTDALVAERPELLVVFGVVGAHIVIGAERMSVLGHIKVVSALLLRLRCEHRMALALDLLALRLVIIGRDIWVVVDEHASFFDLGALVGDVEQLQGRAQAVVDGKLLAHADICNAVG